MQVSEEQLEAGEPMDVEQRASTQPLAANDAPLAPTELLKSTWVQCDRCNKWRRVAKALADSLDEEKPWFCEDNPEHTFSTCSVEQELSNDEIDKTLQENEARDEEGNTPPPVRKVRPAVWELIRDNLYPHRVRKSEKEDDIMVCQCHPPRDGSLGCREDCLNRMLNVECHPDYCPCGEQCSNTMFAKRAYAKLDKRRAGAKGFGLFAKQDLSEGQFIIEYIGEVLEEEEYVRRKMFYQENGQRHYYFMNVGNGEVIDACRKGALGRFINHSCDPNCETQKWLVHGELCIGLFALKDVKADEELTFDYNFERYGDKPMHCYCNAKTCRGFIGGTPDDAMDREAEHQADASEDPEPIMLQEGEAADPALAAILASEVGLASADWHDDRLRRGWEELAATKGLTLDWDLSADSGTSTSSAEEAIAAMAATPHSPEAVEQRLKDNKAQKKKRLETLAHAKAASQGVPPRKRPGKAGSFMTPGGGHLIAPTSSTTGQPASTPAQRMVKWEQPAQKGMGRRSEVDRKLDNLVGPKGRLRDAGQGGIVRMLRLFNLCDLGPTPSAGPASPKVDDSEASSRANGSAGTTTAYPSSGAQLTNGSRATDGESYQEQRRKRRRQDGSLKPSRSTSRDRNDMESSPDLGREEGEIKEPPKARERERLRERTPERVPDRLPDRDADKQLTGRQRARMADLSLLLDVILKTSGSSTKKEFCRCGALRQIQSTLSRCMAPSYAVIIRKMLRAVDHLPLTADDLHQTSSAHGSFADMLKDLTSHADPEVRNRASALLKKHPWSACSLEVQQATQAATANRKRHGRPFYRGGRRDWGDRERRDRGDRDRDGDSDLGGNGGTPIYERTAKQLAARPHRPSRFHGPGEVPATWGPGPAQKAPERERTAFWSSPRARGRDGSLWQAEATPARAAEESGRRPLASPLPMSYSMPPPGSQHHPSPAQPGWKGLHRLHSASGGPSSTLTAAAGWHRTNLDRTHSPAPDAAGMDRPGRAFDRLPPPPPLPVLTPSSQPPRETTSQGLPPPPPPPTSAPPSTEPARHTRGPSRWDPPMEHTTVVPPAHAGAPPAWPRLPNGHALPEASPMSAGLPEGSPLTPAHGAPARSAGALSNSDDSSRPPLPEGRLTPLPPLPDGSPISPGPPVADAALPEASSVSPMSPDIPVGSPMSPRIPEATPALPLQQARAAASAQRMDSSPEDGAVADPPPLQDLASRDPGGPVTAVGWRKPTVLPGADAVQQQRATPAAAVVALRASAAEDEQHSLDGGEGASPGTKGPRFWDEPDASLEEFVVKEVHVCLKKYLQPDHPNRISREEFDVLFKKARRAIMDAERKAYKERQRVSSFKPIDRQKIGPRIKDYVKESIKRHHERKAGLL